jgi:hypothetical protein
MSVLGRAGGGVVVAMDDVDEQMPRPPRTFPSLWERVWLDDGSSSWEGLLLLAVEEVRPRWVLWPCWRGLRRRITNLADFEEPSSSSL